MTGTSETKKKRSNKMLQKDVYVQIQRKLQIHNLYSKKTLHYNAQTWTMKHKVAAKCV
jgi:hypothetical protein